MKDFHFDTEGKLLNFLQSLPCLIHKDIPLIHNKFRVYQQLVFEYGSKFNLISHNDFYIFTVRHLIDSIMLVHLFPQEFHNEKIRIIDVGTGAGLPGIPLAILFPNINFTLLDSNQKKSTFIDNFVKPRISLDNITVLCSRTENLIKSNLPFDNFDFGVSRATANLPIIMDWMQPLIKPNGKCAFWISTKEWNEYKKINFQEKHHVTLLKEGNYKLPISSEEKAMDAKIILFLVNS